MQVGDTTYTRHNLINPHSKLIHVKMAKLLSKDVKENGEPMELWLCESVYYPGRFYKRWM